MLVFFFFFFSWGGMKHVLNQLLGEVAKVCVERLSQQFE